MADVQKEIALKVTTDTSQTTSAFKSAKDELKQTQKALVEMSLAGKQGTAEFKAMEKRAGQLKDAIGDINTRVKNLANDTPKLELLTQAATGIAGGFAVAQGAAALFGDENEDVQKAIMKTQAAMAILNGVQSIANVLNKDAALGDLVAAKAKGVFTAAVKIATGALKSLRGALLATGVGAVVVAVGMLVANFDKVTEAVTKFVSGSPALTKVLKFIGDTFTSIGESLGFVEDKTTKNLRTQIEAAEKQKRLLEAQGKDTAKVEGEILTMKLALAKKTKEGVNEAEEAITLFNAKQIFKREEAEKKSSEKKAELDKAAAKNQAELNQELQKLRLENIQNAEKQSIAQLEIERSQARRQLEDKKASDAVLIEFDKETQTQRNTIITQSQAELNKVTDSLRGENVSSEEAMALALLEVERSKARKLLEDKKASQELLAEFDKQSELQRKAITTQFELEKNQELETLRAQNIQNAEAQALALLEIERKKGRTELEIKGASAALLIEFDKQTEIQRKAITDQAQADRDAKAKEDNDKALANAKIVADALQQARIDSIKNEFDRAQAELEIQRQAKIEELTLAGASNAELLAVQQAFADKSVEIAKEAAEKNKATKMAEVNSALKVTRDSISALNDLIQSAAGQNEAQQKKAFESNKKANIAMALIDTYLGASQVFVSTVGGPIIKGIAAAAAVVAGLARVNAIRRTTFQSSSPQSVSSGGGGVPTGGGGQQQPPAAFNPNVTPTNPTGQPNPQGQSQQPLRAYVVDRDIENASSRRNMLRDFAAI